MSNVGRVFKSQFAGDYWSIIDEKKDLVLIEATYFSGRPRLCQEIQRVDGKICPFPHCNYKRNQFCLNKQSVLIGKDELQGGKLQLEIEAMKGNVVYSDWSHHVAGKEPPCNRKGYVDG